MPDENDKQEITLSKSSSALAVFSSSSLVKRGLDMTDMMVYSPYLQKVREILLSIFNNSTSSEAMMDSAELLMEISPDQNIIARLIEISEDTNISHTARLDTLVILAEYGLRDFAIKKILGMFYSSQYHPDLEYASDIRHDTISALVRIKNINEELQCQILEFNLLHDRSLFDSTFSLLYENGRESPKVYTALINTLTNDAELHVKLTVCDLLLKFGYRKDVEGCLHTFPDLSKPKNYYESAYWEERSRLISILQNFDSQLHDINRPDKPNYHRLYLLNQVLNWLDDDYQNLSNIKIVNIEAWYNFLDDKENSGADISDIIYFSSRLIKHGIETQHATRRLLQIIGDTRFSTTWHKALAIYSLESVELSFDTIHEKILPIFMSDYERLEQRFEAARLLLKYSTTRVDAFLFILSQIDMFVIIQDQNFWSRGIDDDLYNRIGLVGPHQKFINDLLKYLEDHNDEHFNDRRLFVCKCIVRMIRNQNANP